MSFVRSTRLELSLCCALCLAAVPSACAVGVDPEFEDLPSAGAGAGGAGGAPSAFGGTNAGTTTKAGTGSSSAGTSAGRSNGGAGAGGAGGAAGKGGSANGGAGGSTAGAGGASGSAGTGGSGADCNCEKTLPWADNTVMSWATGDCVSVADATYVYVGTKSQTYANAQCNPAKAEPWCSDMGNDYKFMACP